MKNAITGQSVATNVVLIAPQASHCHDHDKIDEKEDSMSTSKAAVSKVDCAQEEFKEDKETTLLSIDNVDPLVHEVREERDKKNIVDQEVQKAIQNETKEDIDDKPRRQAGLIKLVPPKESDGSLNEKSFALGVSQPN